MGCFRSSEGFSQAVLLSGGLSPALFCSRSAASLTAQSSETSFKGMLAGMVRGAKVTKVAVRWAAVDAVRCLLILWP